MSEIHPVQANEVISVIMGLGVCISTPITLFAQTHKILKNKSADGLSFPTLSLAALNAFMAFCNATILNWDELKMCNCFSIFKCLDTILISAQLLILFYFYMVNLCLFMFFYWFPGKKTEEESYGKLKDDNELEFDEEIQVEDKCVQDGEGTMYYKTQRLFISSLYTFLFISYFVMAGIGITLTWVYGSDTESPGGVYARSLGLIATMIIIVQWTPQIFRTIIDRSAGNFSIVMIGIMTPASFVILFYFAVLSGQDWTTWIPYLFSGIQQAILLTLCIYFEYIHKRIFGEKKKPEDEEGETQRLTKPKDSMREVPL
eukprot:gene4191-7501_t